MGFVINFVRSGFDNSLVFGNKICGFDFFAAIGSSMETNGTSFIINFRLRFWDCAFSSGMACRYCEGDVGITSGSKTMSVPEKKIIYSFMIK